MIIQCIKSLFLVMSLELIWGIDRLSQRNIAMSHQCVCPTGVMSIVLYVLIDGWNDVRPSYDSVTKILTSLSVRFCCMPVTSRCKKTTSIPSVQLISALQHTC